METPWHYTSNQFLSATVDNYKKAFQLSTFHDAFLNLRMTTDPMDPDWALLYNRYRPFHVAYINEYTDWKTSGGLHEGNTLTVDQLLALLPARVDTWDSQVKALPGFEKGSAPHQAMFPLGRKPFGKGSKDARVNAVKVLADAMIPYVSLAAVMGAVNMFHSQLLAARLAQISTISDTNLKSTGVNQRRIEVMIEQYRDLGFLIDKSADLPEYINPFFNLNVLRESNQVRFTGTLDPSENEAILIHTFLADDELQLEIIAATPPPPGTMVQFYLATTPGGTDSTAVAVEANVAPTSITAAAFGIINYATHRYLTAINTNAMQLKYVVELE